MQSLPMVLRAAIFVGVLVIVGLYMFTDNWLALVLFFPVLVVGFGIGIGNPSPRRRSER